MKTKELKELKDEAEKLIYLREKGIYKDDCAECFTAIKQEDWERKWEKGDLCFTCLRKWFDNANPKLVAELAIEQIQSNFADDEQIELGGEKACRD